MDKKTTDRQGKEMIDFVHTVSRQTEKNDTPGQVMTSKMMYQNVKTNEI